MAHNLSALPGPLGVVRTAELVGRVDKHRTTAWVRKRRLLRPYPGVLVHPDQWHEWPTRAMAAVLVTDGALSHTSALAVWRVPPEAGPHSCLDPGSPARHPSARADRSPWPAVRRRSAGALSGHATPPIAPRHQGSAQRPSAAPCDSERARASVIDTIHDRRLKARELRIELDLRPNLSGRRALVEPLHLMDEGCQSELEVWGVRHVLRAPGIPHFVQQHPVHLPWTTVHLDAALPELEVAIEMDGAAFHGSAEARERDIRRDAALAARGWVVLRFSYRRLRTEPEGCRREIVEVCRVRQALLSNR